MKKNLAMLMAALLIGVLLVAFILTLIALGFANPVPWIILAVMIAIPILSSRLERRHFLVWKEEYSVGIQAIDEDHHKLLNLINQLQTAVHYQTGEEFEKQALEALVDYTRNLGISWVVWCFDPDWAPYMFTDWEYTPTRQGTFFKKVMKGL